MNKLVSFLIIINLMVACTNSNMNYINALENEFPSDTFCGTATKMVNIEGGKYIPLYGRDSQMVKVSSFSMDEFPVTNKQFLLFVKTNKRWRKSNIKRIYADSNYLQNWQNDTLFNENINSNTAVTNVSWFAAKAYCECQGKRMPTVDEWEFVAMANEHMADARKVKSYNVAILAWYEKPNTYLNLVGQGNKNYWGVHDMIGLVWEWTYDFNSIILPDETSEKNKLFCGKNAYKESDLMNYAAFMRYAFRSSIHANYNLKNVGFRCVKDSI